MVSYMCVYCYSMCIQIHNYTQHRFQSTAGASDPRYTLSDFCVDAKRIRSNSTRGKDRLEGMTPVVEDWHAKVSILGVRTFMYMYFLHVHYYAH